MAFSSQNPNIYHAIHHISNLSIHLSDMASYHSQSRNIDMAAIIHEYRHLNIKNSSSNEACSHLSPKEYFKQMHIHMNAWLTLLTLLHHNTYASMHGHIICMFMAHQTKRRKETLILICEGQTTNKHGIRDSKAWKKTKVEAYYISEIEVKIFGLGFLGVSMQTHTLSMRAHAESMHTHTRPNPNPKNKNKTEKKITTNNWHA